MTSFVAAMQASKVSTPKTSAPSKKGGQKISNKRKHDPTPSTPKGVGEASDAPYQKSTYKGDNWKPHEERGELSSRAGKISAGSGSPRSKTSPPAAKKHYGTSASPASKVPAGAKYQPDL